MAFTNIRYDNARTAVALVEATAACRYNLQVPGNGPKPCYLEDPCLRIQKWGANLRTNSVDLETALRGQMRTTGCDAAPAGKGGLPVLPASEAMTYPVCDAPSVEQTRAIDPPWTALDKDHTRWLSLWNDPQEMTQIPFPCYLSTRVLHKDNFSGCPDADA